MNLQQGEGIWSVEAFIIKPLSIYLVTHEIIKMTTLKGKELCCIQPASYILTKLMPLYPIKRVLIYRSLCSVELPRVVVKV